MTRISKGSTRTKRGDVIRDLEAFSLGPDLTLNAGDASSTTSQYSTVTEVPDTDESLGFRSQNPIAPKSSKSPASKLEDETSVVTETLQPSNSSEISGRASLNEFEKGGCSSSC